MSINWKEIFALQKQLDDRIIYEHGLENEDRIPWRVTAFIVELSEFANEARWFKKWSNDQEPRRMVEVPFGGPTRGIKFVDRVLEEYVDAIHFLVGLGIELDYNDLTDDILKISMKADADLSKSFVSINYLAAHLLGSWDAADYFEARNAWKNTFGTLLAFGRRFGITDSDIERAYKEKHKINNIRQDRGY